MQQQPQQQTQQLQQQNNRIPETYCLVINGRTNLYEDIKYIPDGGCLKCYCIDRNSRNQRKPNKQPLGRFYNQCSWNQHTTTSTHIRYVKDRNARLINQQHIQKIREQLQIIDLKDKKINDIENNMKELRDRFLLKNTYNQNLVNTQIEIKTELSEKNKLIEQLQTENNENKNIISDYKRKINELESIIINTKNELYQIIDDLIEKLKEQRNKSEN